MSFDEKKLLKRENLHQINNFILSDRKTLTLRRPSFLPGTLFSAQTTVLHKHTESLSDNGSHHLGFIYETNLRPDTLNKIPELKKKAIPEHKPDADSFYWQTSQQRIQDAVDYGIFNPGAFTTKVIGALGRYRLDVLERAYHNGIISNKFEHKEMLLRLTQTRIRSLQCLERLTNAYNFGKSTDGNVHRILDTFEDYISQLNTLKQEVASQLKVLNDFDEDAQTKITEQLREDILSAEQYRDALINAWSKDQINQQTVQNTLLNATGPRSIAHFIKLRMIAAVREAQEHNQNMTYSRDAWSLSRGQFNSYCEDALRVINEYQPDHHNPTLAEHQGYYTNTNESVTLNFDHLDKNPQAIRQHLMAITHIEGKDRIARNEEGDYYIINDQQEKPQHKLKTTRLTGWDVQDSKLYLPKRLFSWAWNFIFVGLIGGIVIDLIPNLFLGLFGKEPRSFVGRFRSTFTPVCVKKTHYDLLAKRIEIPIISLGAKVGGAIGNFFRNTTWEIRNGVKTTFQQARFEIVENLISDFQIGHNRLPDDSVLFDKIYSKLDKLQKKEKAFLDQLKELHKKTGVEADSKIEASEIKSRFASAPYELNPGEWSDALNSALNGAKHVVESVTHEVHAKHPFAGLLFNFFYIAGGLAILAPSYVAFLGKYFLTFSKVIADASSTQQFGGAVSAAFYEAYLSATLSEFVISGRDSSLINALTSLEDQPSNFMVYGALAVGLGWFLANVVDIPGVSEGIRDELGTVPAIAYGTAGAKFGILLIELLTVEPGELDPDHNTKREKLKEFFQREYPEFDEAKIDRLIDDILNHTLVLNARPDAKESMQRLQFLLTLQKNQHLVHKLSQLRKRQLIEVMRRQERHNPQLVEAVTQLLFPERKHSILGITLNIFFGYFYALLRCFAAIVTWNSEPFRFLFVEKIPKDLARVYHAINNKLINTAANYCRAMFRGIFDVILNEIVARFEGFVRNKKHSVSRGTYTVSSAFDRGFATVREFLARIFGIDPLRKAVTKPHANSVLHRIFHKYRWDYTATPEHKPSFTSDSIPDEATPSPQNEEENSASRPSKDSRTRRTIQNFLDPVQTALDRKAYYRKNLIREAKENPKKTAKIIRTLMNDPEHQSVFFKELFQIGNPRNVFYNNLKMNDLNYEILSEIIQANFKLTHFSIEKGGFSSSQLIELMCLDRSGNIAVDLLSAQMSRTITDAFWSNKTCLARMINVFYSNRNVLNYLSMDRIRPQFQTTFIEAVKMVYEEFLDTDVEEAIKLLSTLLDNDGTQKAMIQLFEKHDILNSLRNKASEYLDKFNELTKHIELLYQKKSFDLLKLVVLTSIKKPSNSQKPLGLFTHKKDGSFTFFTQCPITDNLAEETLSETPSMLYDAVVL